MHFIFFRNYSIIIRKSKITLKKLTFRTWLGWYDNSPMIILITPILESEFEVNRVNISKLRASELPF